MWQDFFSPLNACTQAQLFCFWSNFWVFNWVFETSHPHIHLSTSLTISRGEGGLYNFVYKYLAFNTVVYGLKVARYLTVLYVVVKFAYISLNIVHRKHSNLNAFFTRQYPVLLERNFLFAKQELDKRTRIRRNGRIECTCCNAYTFSKLKIMLFSSCRNRKTIFPRLFDILQSVI